MKDAGADPFQFEPTVFGAMRRYWVMVLVVAVVITLASVGYALKQPTIYQAQASVTVPQPVSLQGQTPAQYFDSQVLLLQSQNVANQAASIANGELHSNSFSASDFSGAGSSLTITPPTTAAPGAYGASIVVVSFTGPGAKIAQVGANAVLQAFASARSAAIVAQAQATIADINRTIQHTYGPSELGDLQTARTETIINEQRDLAQAPTVASAIEPQSPINHRWHKAVVFALVIGLIVGTALAFARASLRRRFSSRQDPAALYDAPLIGEIPVLGARKRLLPHRAPAADLLPMTAEPHSAAAEAFRFAAGSIERIRAERGPGLSLVFVSPLTDAGKSLVLANLAIAVAEGGTTVLVVDADGDLTARFLPGTAADGLEQVLAGQRVLEECVQPAPFNSAVAVLGSGPATPARATGAARSKAARFFLAEAKARYDVVLIDSPALLKVADATELVGASDAVITVVSPSQLIRDHREMVNRLKLIGSDVVGYIYNRASAPSHRARDQRNGSSASPTGVPDASPEAPGAPPDVPDMSDVPPDVTVVNGWSALDGENRSGLTRGR